jgi:hypothetical protein
MSLLSCVWSLLPLFEDRYLVSEPGLIGTWKEDGGEDTWTFEAGEGKAYQLTQRQAEYDLNLGQKTEKRPGDTAVFQVRIGRLGAVLFLDFYPADNERSMPHNDWLNAHLIPAHTLARVWLAKDSLKLVFLNEDWVSKAIEDSRITLAHVKTEGGYVLTAPTAELQAFILKYADDPKAFPTGSRTDEGALELIRAR